LSDTFIIVCSSLLCCCESGKICNALK
jgi:hypothetical protein